VDRAGLADWVAAYERAWRAAGTEGLARLFTPEATYQTHPYERPFSGLAAISALWEDQREGPDEVFTMTSEVVAVEGATGVVRVEVRYGDPPGQQYRDLWIVRLDDDGRCSHFEEWPTWPRSTPGGFASGPPGNA
jgi:hypothetical protein